MEIESKFLVWPEDTSQIFGEILDLQEIDGFRYIELGDKKIIDTYSDTLDDFLLKNNSTYRVRLVDEEKYLITHKHKIQIEDGFFKRKEYEVEFFPENQRNLELAHQANLARIDLEPVNQVRRFIGKRPLASVLKVFNDRKTILLENKDHKQLKLMLDEVRYNSPLRTNNVSDEIEVEIIEQSGTTKEDLRTISEFLTNNFNLRPSRQSKYERGRLILGRLKIINELLQKFQNTGDLNEISKIREKLQDFDPNHGYPSYEGTIEPEKLQIPGMITSETLGDIYNIGRTFYWAIYEGVEK